LEKFLEEKLKLAMHPKKVFLKTLNSGVDFLGWVQFHGYRVLRTTTKNRMLKKIKINKSQPTLVAYLALLKHGNSYKIKNKINSINKPL
jgi:hypothetical protein